MGTLDERSEIVWSHRRKK